MTNFNERTNTLLYKNIYLSHFILDISVVCERWVESGTDCYTDPNSSSDHSSTSSASKLSCSTGGRWGPQPSVCKLVLILAFLCPTNSTPAATSLYSFITPTVFRFFFRLFAQVRLLIDGSVKGQYTILNMMVNSIWWRGSSPGASENFAYSFFSFDPTGTFFSKEVCKNTQWMSFPLQNWRKILQKNYPQHSGEKSIGFWILFIF